MAKRLDIDAHVLAYLGFDEANETDPAIDESSYGRNFSVFNSPAVNPARVNNGRQFNGSSTYCSPTDSAPFQQAGNLTIIGWFILDQINSSGSLMRTILECAGVGSGEDANSFYGLYVSSTGEIVYQHDFGAAHTTVFFKTAAGTVKTGRYYSLVVQRQAVDASTCNVSLILDNQPLAWASCAVGGVPQNQSLPVPLPTGGTISTLQIGKSVQYGDGAYWQGTLDEISIHDTVRTLSPYLRSVYFRLTLYTRFFRLTAYNNVKSVGSAEMGGGSRWWVYERDSSIYVVRENSLGLFAPEVTLTTGGLTAQGYQAPGGTGMPDLVYDPASDTLLVAFVQAGKVYKMTASVGDTPAPQSMPYVQETAGVVKLHVNTTSDAFRLGSGEAVRDPAVYTGQVFRSALKQNFDDSAPLGSGEAGSSRAYYKGYRGDVGESAPASLANVSLQFTEWPSFGIAIDYGPSYPQGIALYSYVAGVETFLGVIKYNPYSWPQDLRYIYFVPITNRVYGMKYYAKGISPRGVVGVNVSNSIQDLFGAPNDYGGNPNALVWSRDGDYFQLVAMASGEGQRNPADYVGQVFRTPVKFNISDPLIGQPMGSGEGMRLTMSCTYSPTAPQRVGIQL